VEVRKTQEGELLVTVQLHPAAVETSTAPTAGELGKDCEAGDIEKLQEGGLYTTSAE
jgi:hypothetical protein